MKIFIVELFANIQFLSIMQDETIQSSLTDLSNILAIIIVRVLFLGGEFLLKYIKNKRNDTLKG